MTPPQHQSRRHHHHSSSNTSSPSSSEEGMSTEGHQGALEQGLVVSHSTDSYGAMDVATAQFNDEEKKKKQQDDSVVVAAYYEKPHQLPHDDEPLWKEGIEKKKRKITFWTVFDFSKKWLALIIGCLMMLVSGTQYAFSSISPMIKRYVFLKQ